MKIYNINYKHMCNKVARVYKILSEIGYILKIDKDFSAMI